MYLVVMARSNSLMWNSQKTALKWFHIVHLVGIWLFRFSTSYCEDIQQWRRSNSPTWKSSKDSSSVISYSRFSRKLTFQNVYLRLRRYSVVTAIKLSHVEIFKRQLFSHSYSRFRRELTLQNFYLRLRRYSVVTAIKYSSSTPASWRTFKNTCVWQYE